VQKSASELPLNPPAQKEAWSARIRSNRRRRKIYSRDGPLSAHSCLHGCCRATLAARLIEAGYDPAAVYETMVSVGLGGTVERSCASRTAEAED
jgi:hypothetical protein